MVTLSTTIPVPALGHSLREWTVTDEGASRAARKRENGPYSSTVPAALTAEQFSIPTALAAELADAEQALARFDTHTAQRLGPNSVVLGPMSAILLRTESTSSSQIEQLTTSARQLALAELNESVKSNAITVVGNVHAMEAALRLADSLDERSVLAMHLALLSRQPGWEIHAGTWRTSLVWVGGSRFGPRNAAHIGPDANLVPSAMQDLFQFIARDDLPILAHTAIAHAQFETIHPFSDGNGRTGRALAHAMLRNKGLVRNATVPLSAGILRNTEDYFAALGAFRAGDAAPIVSEFARAALFAASSGTALVDNLADELARNEAAMGAIRKHATARQVLPHLIAQPVVNSSFLEATFGIGKMTVARALDTLVRVGILTESTGKQRSRVYEHRGILAILDEYAASLRRS